MKRDLKKAVQDYKAKYYNSNSPYGEGAFYASDIYQIKDLAEEAAGVSRFTPEVLYNAIVLGLEAGFMVGYRKAVRDAKKSKKHNM